MLLKRCERLRQLLNPLDVAALCIAALGHDIGHLGVNNSFLVSATGCFWVLLGASG